MVMIALFNMLWHETNCNNCWTWKKQQH